jgi:hypothetical protein
MEIADSRLTLLSLGQGPRYQFMARVTRLENGEGIRFRICHHVTRRGNRREAIFFAEGDHKVYRALLAEQTQGIKG